MNRTGVLAAGSIVLFSLAGAAARGETDYVWPRFAVSAGAYEISTQDELRLNGELELLGRPVDFQSDLGLPDSKTLLGFGIDWAFAQRHSVDLLYYSLDREGSRSISREIEIDGTVFPVGAELAASFETTAIEGSYTYWFVRRERFGIGGSLGLVDLALDVEASATARLGPGGVTFSEEASASTDLPVPMIGLAVKGSPIDRLVLYAHARFLPSVSIGDYDGEAGSYALGATYFVYGPLALGASFSGNYYTASLDDADWSGEIDLVQNGWNLFLRFAW